MHRNRPTHPYPEGRFGFAILLLLLIGLFPHDGSAQSTPPLPTCRQSLDSLDAKVRQNYAGFLLEVRGERRSAYEQMLRRTEPQADKTSLNHCYGVLASYIGWYDDPHLFVFQSQSAAFADSTLPGSLRQVALSENELRASLRRKGSKHDPIEGIWYEGALRIGVVPDPADPRSRFLGVVLTSDTIAWPVGAVRATFTRKPDGSYATVLLTRSFAEMELTAWIHKRVLLRLSPGIWGREFPLAPADTGLIDPTDAHRPRVSVRDRSVLFSIPSHDPANLGMLDSLVQANASTIASKPLLLIDLRGNEGGGSFMSRALDPYISSRDRRPTPFDSGAAVALSSPAQISYARRFTGTRHDRVHPRSRRSARGPSGRAGPDRGTSLAAGTRFSDQRQLAGGDADGPGDGECCRGAGVAGAAEQQGDGGGAAHGGGARLSERADRLARDRLPPLGAGLSHDHRAR